MRCTRGAVDALPSVIGGSITGRVRRERMLSEDSGGRLCSFRTG